MKCIYGLEDLASGEIHINGRQVLGPAYHLIPGDEDMRLVSQDFYVLDNHTVGENIYDRMIGYADTAKKKRAVQVMKLLELQHLAGSRARFLSSGQKQRVAIARALAVMPRILLLDEPFSNLDNLLTEKLFAFISNEVKKSGTSVILVTHLAEEALKYTNSLAVMNDGRISQYGPTWNVYYKPKSTRLAGLLGAYNIVAPVDLEKGGSLQLPSRRVVRPDQLVPARRGEETHLQLNVINCVFNGKCFELLAEHSNGHTFIIYHQSAMAVGTRAPFRLILDHTPTR